MHKLKIFASALSAALALSICHAANAAIITYTLNDVTFDDGTGAWGSFEWDSSANKVVNFNVFVSYGRLTEFEYTNNTSYTKFSDEFTTFFLSNDWDRYLRFTYSSSLNTAGNHTIIPGAVYSYECMECSPYRIVRKGSVTAPESAAVPEPAAWALMIGGFGMAGAMLRRRQAIASAA